MRSRLFVFMFACLAAVVASLLTAPDASSTAAAVDESRTRAQHQRVTLERPRATDQQRVVLVGRAPARSRVGIIRKTDSGWRRVEVVRARRHGRYRVVVPRPARARWVVKAVGRKDTSRKRVVAPLTTALSPAPTTDPAGPTDPAVPSADACGDRVQKADGTWWECSFVDEFDGDTIDPTKWVAQETAFSGMTNGSACYVKSPETLSVAEGTLRLSAVKHDQQFTCASPFGSFATDRAAAAVTTKGRFAQAYGRFEMRARMDTLRVPGAHSAFWLFPDARKYGAWPLSGEIDVVEWYSALPRRAYPSVHYVDGDRNVHTGQNGVIADVSEYHTYAVEWTPKKMRFFYDGVLTFEHSWTALAPLVGSQPFDQPFNVVLTQAWGGLWNAPTALTPNRVTMTVDRVRVWK